MQQASASQSVRAIATRADRACRASAARRRIVRAALPVAATACLASALGPVLGGPASIGLFVLAAGVAGAGLMALAAGRSRELRDRAVADLDYAAGLDGSLRSAHWFAVEGATEAGRHANASWIGRHLEQAASRASDVDWTRVYHRPSARLPWVLTVACALATLGFAARPLPRLLKKPIQLAESAPTSTAAPPPAGTSSFVPQILEGMRVMSSGRTPSEEQLSAIGRALEATKNDPAARKQIETEVSGSSTADATPHAWSGADIDSGGWSDDYDTGFEITDLEWAYQEAMARARMEELSRPDPAAEAAVPEGSAKAASNPRPGEPAAAGELTGAPVAADTRGQAVDFSSLLLGRQQATGAAVAADPAQVHGRAVRLSAALRNEVVHARADFTAAKGDIPAVRRATSAAQTTAVAGVTAGHIRYDRSRATQPPAVPAARRLLVHDFFLRPADAAPAAKRP